MIRNWFNSREATEIGIALADQYARERDSTAIPNGAITAKGQPTDPLQDILDRAGRELHTLRLNFYKRAKFANSFKWRLLEKGVGRDLADTVTEKLVLHLSLNPDRFDAKLERCGTGRSAAAKKCALSSGARE